LLLLIVGKKNKFYTRKVTLDVGPNVYTYSKPILIFQHTAFKAIVSFCI